jgi:proliferating cell nuclear antigen
MKLTLTEPKYLKESISIISELISEAKFHVTKQSLKMIAMDPANVAMVVFELFSSSFAEYEVEEETEFALNLGYFKQILKRADASDSITLTFTKENMLNIEMKGKSSRNFTISILEAEEHEQKIPTLSFGVTVTAPSSIFNSVVDDASVIMADSIIFRTGEKKISFIAESDMNKVKVDITEDDDIKLLNNEGADQISAKYAIEYLKKIFVGSKLTERVKISFNNEYPIKIEYNVLDKVQLMFILAPRVADEN